MTTHSILVCACLSLVARSAPAQEIISNGSFETISVAQGHLALPPWVLPPPGDWGGQFGGGSSVPVDGENFITFRGLAYQDLSTVPGATYRVSFWTGDLSTDGIHQWPSQLRVLWGGMAVATQQVDWPEWRSLDYLVTATGSVTRLGLEVQMGLEHSLRFDDVSCYLVRVPEPGVGVLGFIGVLLVWALSRIGPVEQQD
jgi:hypothetical protein